MLWPSRSEYTEAVRDYPHVSLQDPKLNGGESKRGKDGFLTSYVGGYSIVFPIDIASKTFALRCWTQEVGNAELRYERISACLNQVPLRYFVDFEYVSEGILVNGTRYPITRMEWIEGVSLREFIEQNLQNAHVFKVVADEFQKMVADLHHHQISHGDLQDGNILIRQNGDSVELKLIDYDSLFVPTLQGQSEQIVGLPEYQHPKRIAGGGQANEKVDYFSELVIYLSFLSLSEKPDLWTQFGDEKRVDRGLLFSKEDFETPSQSTVFQELARLSPDIRQLAAILKGFCAKTSIDQLKPLEEVLPKPDANTYRSRGDSFRKSGQYNEALAEYQKAIDIKSDYEMAHFGRGHAYRHTNRYAEAINAFQQAIRFKPNYKEAHYGLGIALFQSGDHSEAIAAVNVALRIDPSYQPARQLLNIIRNRLEPDPPEPDPDPPEPDPGTNVWRYFAVLFGTALVVCALVLAVQIDKKNAALRKVKAKDLEIQQLSDSFQTLEDDLQILEKGKRAFISENEKLKSQLAEKDTEIQRLTSRARVLELPTRSSMEGMVLIPDGNFHMGSNDAAAYTDEKPVHTVYVSAFYIDKYEVTNEDYKKFVDANPQWRKDRILRQYHDGDYLKYWTGNSYPYKKGNHPVTWVSWYAATAYAQWKGKRLPTEAEWEKAARGGLVNNHLLGNLVNFQTANYNNNVGSTTRIGNYQANPYGLYDMVGNVSEWCLDAYSSNFYANSARRNPVAGGSIYSIVRDFKNLNASRVLRGGSWSSDANAARIAYRFSNSPGRTSPTTGFRCVKPATP